MKSTDFASKDLYKESSSHKETKSRISSVMRQNIVNSDMNLVKKPVGKELYSSQHMNIFVKRSRYGADGSHSSVKIDKKGQFGNEYGMAKEKSLAFRMLPREHPSVKKVAALNQVLTDKLLNPLDMSPTAMRV